VNLRSRFFFFFEETDAKKQREETFVTSLLLYARVVPRLYIKYTYVYIHVFYKYKNSGRIFYNVFQSTVMTMMIMMMMRAFFFCLRERVVVLLVYLETLRVARIFRCEGGGVTFFFPFFVRSPLGDDDGACAAAFVCAVLASMALFFSSRFFSGCSGGCFLELLSPLPSDSRVNDVMFPLDISFFSFSTAPVLRSFFRFVAWNLFLMAFGERPGMNLAKIAH